jgi:MoaA/NifB/PqqE/SkfB family radical SAM enzyme
MKKPDTYQSFNTGSKLTDVPPVLPFMICFRVTRFCNARCGFCLAPPDGGKHPDASTLKNYIDWLLSNGVKTIHFSGGEPSIHKDLPELINYVKSKGGRSKMTTNGIALCDDLITTLHDCKTEVKVSLHGPEHHHNRILACDAFHKTTENIKRLLKARVPTSIQTTIISGHLDVVAWMVRFCKSNGIRRVSFMPFIPRGRGCESYSKFKLSQKERRALRSMVTQARRKNMPSLEVRLLDFTARPIHVMEPDGRIVLEGATEGMDKVLYKLVDENVGV